MAMAVGKKGCRRFLYLVPFCFFIESTEPTMRRSGEICGAYGGRILHANRDYEIEYSDDGNSLTYHRRTYISKRLVRNVKSNGNSWIAVNGKHHICLVTLDVNGSWAVGRLRRTPFLNPKSTKLLDSSLSRCDPDILKRIGAATALEVRATGIPYAFAPCIAVCRDRRWDRCY